MVERTAPYILIIDDEPVSALGLSFILDKEGFKVEKTDNGISGRALARKTQPDLILLDVVMPEEDGFTTCRKLKEEATTADIPVIFLSADQEAGSKVEGLTLGAVDYITKPFHRAEILARIRTHLRLHQAYRREIEANVSKLKQLTLAQQAILPHPEDCPQAHYSIFYQPLEAAGGDFYEVVKVGDGIFDYIVADISGHDLGSSLATASLKTLLLQHCSALYTPLDILKLINSVMCSLLSEGKFLTLAFIRLNRLREEITYVSAGHPPLLMTYANGNCESHEMEGDLLGIFPSIRLQSKIIKVHKGDRFFLYTDGLIEIPGAASRSRRMAVAKLLSLCQEQRNTKRELAVSNIIKNLFADSQKSAKDDLLLLCAEIS